MLCVTFLISLSAENGEMMFLARRTSSKSFPSAMNLEGRFLGSSRTADNEEFRGLGSQGMKLNAPSEGVSLTYCTNAITKHPSLTQHALPT